MECHACPKRFLRLQRERADSQYRGHLHQLGQRLRAHLLHHTTAMRLDGSFAYAKVGAHLLVQPARGDEVEYLPLAPRQQFVAAPQFHAFGLCRPPLARKLDAAPYRLQQHFVVNRLLEAAGLPPPDSSTA
jgi:hypothetical protein